MLSFMSILQSHDYKHTEIVLRNYQEYTGICLSSGRNLGGTTRNSEDPSVSSANGTRDDKLLAAPGRDPRFISERDSPRTMTLRMHPRGRACLDVDPLDSSAKKACTDDP
jgi:hypothetical protein